MSTIPVRRAGPEHREAPPWRIGMSRAKLQVRGRLPGAFGFDLAAHGHRQARAAGLAAVDLLPMALPGSWMVNNKIPSPVFYRWLQPNARAEWITLLELLDCDAAGWLARGEHERSEVASCVAALAALDLAARGANHGAGHGTAAGLSKVLALLCPDIVPLMDDAAIWFALGAVARPDTADTPSAGAELFVPMLDWFAAAVLAAGELLTALARDYTLAPVSAAQVLDRLLWFETWGYRVCRTPSAWWWVADGEREAIVPMPAPPPAASPARVPLGTILDDGWRESARQALALVHAS